MTDRTGPSIDAERLWRSLEAVSLIGATAGGGIHRLAGSAEDGRARDLVVEAARAAGASVRIDRVGNVFLTVGPADVPGGLLMGSHIDSQPRAGRYDGTYGVMAGLEVLLCLQDVPLTRPVTLVIWTDEEGARFGPMVGSSVFAGRLDAADALATRDGDGITLADALDAIGYRGTDVVSPEEFSAYLEAHIEQGPLLERDGTDIGVVEGVQGQYWTQVHMTGAKAHAGTFPLEDRNDALVAAAEVVGAVRSIGLRRPLIGRATVGRLLVQPNSPNVVPGDVEFVVELRHPRQEDLDEMDQEVGAELAEAGARHGVEVTTGRILAAAPVRFDPDVVRDVDAAAERLGLSRHPMVSGAGHDAVPVSRTLPVGMIFVPCHGGVSHAEHESMTKEWAANGAAVLREVVGARAG